MNDIFISYANEDRDKVEPLAKALMKLGWSVFWDRTIPPGKTWDEVIEDAIESSKCVIVVWSGESVKSGWVRAEAEEGLDRKILVPVLIEDVKIPLRFRPIQAARLIDWKIESDISEFENLVRVIKAVIGSPQQIKAALNTSIGMKFVLIPSGSFMMGSKLSPDKVVQKYGGEVGWFSNEHPQHPVEISKPFYIQDTVVTQAQWKNVMGGNRSYFKNCGNDCPIVNVSWTDVQKFIEALNKTDEICKYRLPTEAEWEYACRAGSTKEFSFDDDPKKLDEYAWYVNNSFGRTQPVAQKKANVWGLYDMHGNVWEWCQDWLGDYPSDPVTDPKGSPSGTYHVLRGGSFNDKCSYVRCAFRNMYVSFERGRNFGFRLVAHRL